MAAERAVIEVQLAVRDAGAGAAMDVLVDGLMAGTLTPDDDVVREVAADEAHTVQLRAHELSISPEVFVSVPPGRRATLYASHALLRAAGVVAAPSPRRSPDPAA